MTGRPTKIPELQILYEDNHLLALNKPAGLATMGAAADAPSLVGLARQYLKHRYQKPGNVYIGVVSRLDAVVSGVVLLARTSKAAARLTEQFRLRSVKKTYWAVVPGVVEPESGEWIDWLIKDESQHKMVVAPPGRSGSKEARLSYHRKATLPRGSLVEIALKTGRKHQIRVQLAERGFPILGDRKYGSRSTLEPSSPAIALHARALTVRHPVRDESISLVAPLPASWARLGVAAQ